MNDAKALDIFAVVTLEGDRDSFVLSDEDCTAELSSASESSFSSDPPLSAVCLIRLVKLDKEALPTADSVVGVPLSVVEESVGVVFDCCTR